MALQHDHGTIFTPRAGWHRNAEIAERVTGDRVAPSGRPGTNVFHHFLFVMLWPWYMSNGLEMSPKASGLQTCKRGRLVHSRHPLLTRIIGWRRPLDPKQPPRGLNSNLTRRAGFPGRRLPMAGALR